MSKLLRIQNVLEKTGLGRSTIYALIKQNNFPPAIKLSGRSVAWVEADIDHWINEKRGSL
jgi:prophage regulatory protein